MWVMPDDLQGSETAAGGTEKAAHPAGLAEGCFDLGAVRGGGHRDGAEPAAAGAVRKESFGRKAETSGFTVGAVCGKIKKILKGSVIK